MTTGWESQAENWVAWARTPGHDVFPYYAPAFMDDIVGEASGPTLEVGCGEGRVVRELLVRGHDVVALDLAPTLIRHAAAADARAVYTIGSGTSLPFAGASFGTVVMYNALQAMTAADDMRVAVAEAARVLRPGGHLCVSVPHPFSDFLLVLSAREGADGPQDASYFERLHVEDSVNRGGIDMTFHGRTHTLGDYTAAIEAAGLVIERLREPVPPIQQPDRPDLARWRREPLFLTLRAAKPSAP